MPRHVRALGGATGNADVLICSDSVLKRVQHVMQRVSQLLRDIADVDSLYSTMLNCNKRSITLNMKSDEGKRIFAELAVRSDVLVENFGPGVLVASMDEVEVGE